MSINELSAIEESETLTKDRENLNKCTTQMVKNMGSYKEMIRKASNEALRDMLDRYLEDSDATCAEKYYLEKYYEWLVLQD